MSKNNVARDVIWPNDKNVLVRVVVLYVGQGASALVFAADGDTYKVLLVDINLDRNNGGIDVPRLMNDLLNGQPLEAFINTHPHDDHLSGVDELAENVDILEVWHSGHVPSKKYGSCYEKLHAVIKKVKDDHGEESEILLVDSVSPKTLGETEYYVLSPSESLTEDVNEDEADQRRARIHEQCAVLKFGISDSWIMITGDADHAAFQKHITDRHRDRLDAFTLAASHHGSRSFFNDSEDDDPYLEALNLIDPTYVAISAPTQEESQYDHPDDDAVELYADKAGKENVWHTGEERDSFIFDIFKDGSNPKAHSDDGALSLEYALDEEEGDDDSGSKAKSTAPFVTPRSPTGDRSPRRFG